LPKNNTLNPGKTGFLWVYQTVDQNLPICYTSIIVNNKEPKMSKLTAYTLEIYKKDRRIKEGQRLVEKKDFCPVTQDYIQTVVSDKIAQGFVVKLFETFVTRTNLMGGKEYQERYDTPRFCSPSSEAYWSM
jgi:hypothetical protein